mgnify:CR=1 FL=1
MSATTVLDEKTAPQQSQAGEQQQAADAKLLFFPPATSEDSADLGIKPPPWAEPAQSPLQQRSLSEVLAGDAAPEALTDADVDDSRRWLQELGERAYEEGLQRARDEVQALQERYQASLAELEDVRANVLNESESDIAELALYIAQQLVLQDMSSRRAFTEQMAEKALTLLRQSDRITLHVSPTDYSAIKEQHEALTDPNRVVEVVEDPDIEMGGIIAESSLGRVDGTLKARLEKAAQQLSQNLAGPGDE